MSDFQPFRCAECGAEVGLTSGPGRAAEYRRGMFLPIPDSFAVPTCTSCREMYFTVERSAQLAKLQASLIPPVPGTEAVGGALASERR